MAEVSFASLSPTLLARKGGAKPAMRPQHAALATMEPASPTADPEKLEDLGWNDMGENDDQPHTAEVVSLAPVRSAEPVPANVIAAEPEVLRQRDAAAERIAAPGPAAAPVSVAAPASRPKAKRGADRAAFTLRLDTDRHLKLRLACTVRDCSAQALVTEALDALLGDMPELEALAAQVKRR